MAIFLYNLTPSPPPCMLESSILNSRGIKHKVLSTDLVTQHKVLQGLLRAVLSRERYDHHKWPHDQAMCALLCTLLIIFALSAWTRKLNALDCVMFLCFAVDCVFTC